MFRKHSYLDGDSEDPGVSVEKSNPALYIALRTTGLLIVKEEPSGGYQLARKRLFPLAIMMVIVAWSTTDAIIGAWKNSYDSAIFTITLTVCGLNVLASMILIVVKRNATCRFFSALDKTSKPMNIWKTIVSSLVFCLYVTGYCLGDSWPSQLNHDIQIRASALVFSCLISLSSIVDLHVASVIGAITQAYSSVISDLRCSHFRQEEQLDPKVQGDRRHQNRRTAEPERHECQHATRTVHDRRTAEPERHERQHAVWTVHDIHGEWLPDTNIGNQYMGGGWPTPRPITTGEVVASADHLTRLLELFNQAYSMRLLVRCAVSWVLSMSLEYFFTTHAGDALVSLVIFCFIVDELLHFYLLCYRADLLQQAHLALEDTVWELYQRLEASQRPILASLAFRLNSRRAIVSVGGIGVLGRSLFLSFFNLSCTYTAILYQYRPNLDNVASNTTITSH